MSTRRRRIIKNTEQKNTVIMTLDEILEIPNLVASVNHTHHLCSRNYIHYQEENITEDQIYLITQFFIHRDRKRNIELRHCLKKNCKVTDTIILLNERIYSQEELGLNDEEIKKIEQVVVGKRLSYKIFLDFIRNSDLTGYFILSNTDIFFNETVTNLRKSFLHIEKSMYAISRREIDSLGEITEKHMNSDSQDTWILHSNNLIEDTENFDFNLGVLGCDNRVTMLFHLLEFKIYNCPNFINTFHFHEDDKRDYSRDVLIPSPYLYPIPLLKHKKISLVKMDKLQESLEKNNLFWQYPVVTEKKFYESNKHSLNYLGIPWATVIDKNVNCRFLRSLPKRNYYTCCQHIYFRKLIPLLRTLGVKVLFTPHKTKGQDIIKGIEIKACPLYAINFEDLERNTVFKRCRFREV